MDGKRLTEWLGSIEGLTKALIGVIGAPTLVFVAVTDQLKPVASFLGLPDWISQAAALLLLITLVALVWRSYRRFAVASRLEQPDRFTLVATTPDDLIGRDDDLRRLQLAVARNRIVLLDGESGCGKSALVEAGLVSRLKVGHGFVPIVMRDWGDHWVRGPAATALGALFEILTPEEREALGWTSCPDLAGSSQELIGELDARLNAIGDQFARRPLLVADQFDDYQAQHRENFLDVEGNWLRPDALAATNPFWNLVRRHVTTGKMHLLAVTRADTASGFSCIRFLDKTMTADRQLPRVEVEHLRPLLTRIAPNDVEPLVVSNPGQGWHELRDRLEKDLRAQGAILMQQVRTVLLGLRLLPVLTVRAYRRAGGTRGLEMLVVARAVRRAGTAAGGGESGQRLARVILRALVSSGDLNQPAKAQRCATATLHELAGDPGRADLLLRALQAEELVRPAESAGGEIRWQLDHDYLARGVLAEARHADQWGMALREGAARFQYAEGRRQRWASLLSISVQARLLWEWVRGRLKYGDASRYACLSLLKPGLALTVTALVAGAAFLLNADRRLTADSRAIYERFGGANEGAAVMALWRAPERVRLHLYRLLLADEDRLERATRCAWPLAHGGLEDSRLIEAATLLRARIEKEADTDTLSALADSYAVIASRLAGQNGMRAEAAALYAAMERMCDGDVGRIFADSYAAVSSKLTDQNDLQAAAVVLRGHIVDLNQDDDSIGSLGRDYAAVASKVINQNEIEAGLAMLRAAIGREGRAGAYNSLGDSYAAVAVQLTGQDDIRKEAAALRGLMARDVTVQGGLFLPAGQDGVSAPSANALAHSYVTVASKLTGQDDIRVEAAALRGRIARNHVGGIVGSLKKDIALAASGIPSADTANALADSYAAVASNLTDQNDIRAEVAGLRASMTKRGPRGYIVKAFARCYAAVSLKLVRQDDVRAEAVALRADMGQERDADIVAALADSYAAVASRLVGQDLRTAAGMLRARVQEDSYSHAANFASAYATVAAQLPDEDEIRAATTVLHAAMQRDDKPVKLSPFLVNGQPSVFSYPTMSSALMVSSYAKVASNLTTKEDLKDALAELRPRSIFTGGVVVKSAEYAAVASKLTDQEDIRTEAAALRVSAGLGPPYAAVVSNLTSQDDIRAEVRALRALVEQEHGANQLTAIGNSYAAVVSKLNGEDDIRGEVVAWRTRMEQERDVDIVAALAKGYGPAARRYLEVVGKTGREADVGAAVAEILSMLGHPFLHEGADILKALEPVAQRSFGSDAGGAVAWWMARFGGDPASLRPKPI